MDGCMDGWMDGWMYGWMDGWVYGCRPVSIEGRAAEAGKPSGSVPNQGNWRNLGRNNVDPLTINPPP